MASSALPRLKRGGRSSGGTPSAKTLCFLWLFCACVLGLTGGLAQAMITTGGNVYPPYRGHDPWHVVGPLYIAETTDGSMTVNDGSEVFSYEGEIASSGAANGMVTIDGTDSSWTIEYGGNLDVGLFGPGKLTIQNGGSVSDGNGWLGVGSDAIGTAIVDGTDSSWENFRDLLVGFRGSGNLTVRKGGRVSSRLDGILGYHADSDGTVTVDGAGSSWTHDARLHIGHEGSGALTVQNGGSVSSGVGRLGYRAGSFGAVLVTDRGSTWENTQDLWLGNSDGGGFGWLTVANEGTVYVGDAASSGGIDDCLIVSNYSDFIGGHLNVYDGGRLDHRSHAIVGHGAGEYGWATVDGADSSWTNTGSLFVGYSGSGALAVQNGGNVSSINGYIGYWGAEGSGMVTVDGSESTWENTGDLSLGNSFNSGVGSLIVTEGGTVYVGDAARGGGGDDGLIVSDADGGGSAGGHLYVYDGSTLTCGSWAILGHGLNQSGWATVDGTGSSWSNGESLVIGYSGAGTLSVQNGGQLSNADGWLGFGTSATGSATVEGAGSSWDSAGPLVVGFTGAGMLHVRNGGNVSNVDGLIGNYTDSSGIVLVDGADSVWENSGNLSLGDSSDSGVGSLTVSSGGTVYVGDAAHAGGRLGSLTVGDTDGGGSSGGHLHVYNGSTLTVGSSAFVGDGVGHFGWATVDGPASTWSIDETLIVGHEGHGTLTVQNDATVSNKDGWVGRFSGATGTVTVTGSGSSWENTDDLTLGASSFRGVGSLAISDGGTVYVGDAAISSGPDGWLTISDLDVSGSAGGHLGVYKGSSLIHGGVAVLGNDTAEYGWATVDGAGSRWSNGGWLLVGYEGHGTLTVQNGAAVSNTDGWVGRFLGATGTVTVTGSGSSWENTEDLSLGASSFGGVGSLTVSGGGTVYVGDAAVSSGPDGWLTISDFDSSGSAGGHLGVYNGSTLIHGGVAVLGNDTSEFGWAAVDGAGSSWSNGGWLLVGYEGHGTLTVQNGAAVSNTDGWVGRFLGGTGTVSVISNGSIWENTEDLYLGAPSFGGVGSLAITGGGTVYVGDAARAGGTSGRLTVSDTDGSGATGGHLGVYAGSTLTVDSSAFVGDESGELGWAVVDGSGATWTTGGVLCLGYRGGSGTLTIQNGGRVVSNLGWIANATVATGTVIVNGIGSSWSNHHELYVGYFGSGTLAIQNGGSVTGADSCLGYGTGAAGTATVDGAESTWATHDLIVGRYGAGVLEIAVGDSGGSVVSRGNAFIGRYTSLAANRVTIGHDGLWDVDGSLWVGGGTEVEGPGASSLLVVEAGGMVSTIGNIWVWGPGEVDLQGGTVTPMGRAHHLHLATGTLSGNGTIAGSIVNDGRVAPNGPASAAGRMDLTGNYTQTTGRLEIDIWGTASHDVDRLVIDGTATLGNSETGFNESVLSIDVNDGGGSYVDPTAPGENDAFYFLRCIERSDVFGEITYDGSTLSPAFSGPDYFRSYAGEGLFRIVKYENLGVTLINYRALPGDINGDLLVDVSDFNIWNANKFSAGTEWLTGDLNRDGTTDVSDFNIWNAHKFTTAEIAPAVPEPTQIVLWLTALVASVVFRLRGQ